MSELLAEIFATILIVLILSMVYVKYINYSQSIISSKSLSLQRFIINANLIKCNFTLSQLWNLLNIQENNINISILPALNITLYPNSSNYVTLEVKSWSGFVLPSNFTIMKITSITNIKTISGTIIGKASINMWYDSNAIYIVLVRYYDFATFRIFAPDHLVRYIYDTEQNRILNSTNVSTIYAIIPYYASIIPINFITDNNGYVKPHYDVFTVAFLVMDQLGNMYLVPRFPYYKSQLRRVELVKYVICEYVFYIEVGKI